MLIAWGVHHLHFSQEVEAVGFVKRGNAIIYAIFRPERAFFIDILTHEDWARKHVVQVIVDNWPNEDFIFEAKGFVGLSRSIDDEGLKTLRNGGVNSPLEINGKVYFANGGISCASMSISAVRRADFVVESLECFAQTYEQNPDKIISLAAIHGVAWPDKPEFTAEFRPDGFGVRENKSQAFFPLSP